MVQIRDNQFWWVVVSAILIVIGSILPFACEQLLGDTHELCYYGSVACLVIGFIGLMISICTNGGNSVWAMGIIGGILLFGATLACVTSCYKNGQMKQMDSWLTIPAILGLLLLMMAAAANGSGGWFAIIAALFLIAGTIMLGYQRKNNLVDGLALPMVGMGWVLLAIAAAAE